MNFINLNGVNMKNYDLAVINRQNTKLYMVFSTNYISPLKMIDEIQVLLGDIVMDSAEIFFDFLLCNKNDRERYAKMVCTDGLLDVNQFSYISVDKKSELRKISAHYYKENYHCLDWTYVSEAKKKLIANGVVI